MIPFGQRIKFDSLDHRKTNTNKNNPINHFGIGNSGAYNLEKVLAQYADAVDWVDEECDDVPLPEAIKDISERFDIKSFKDIKGNQPVTKEIIPLFDPDKDINFKYDENYFNDEQGMAIGITERLGVKLLPQGEKYMEQLTVDDYVTRMYNATVKLIYRLTQPKEVIKFNLERSQLYGPKFNAVCALISQEFVSEMKSTLMNIIKDASRCELPYLDIITLNTTVDMITSQIQFTSNYFTDIATQSFARCIQNPEFDGEFALGVFYEKIDKLSNSQLRDHLDSLNKDIFKISLRVCKDTILHMNLSDYKKKANEFINWTHARKGINMRPMKRKEWYEKIIDAYYNIFDTFRDLDIRYTGDIMYDNIIDECEPIVNYIDPIVYESKTQIISGWS